MQAGRSRRERLLPRHASLLRDKSQVFDNSRNQRDARGKERGERKLFLFIPKCDFQLVQLYNFTVQRHLCRFKYLW